MSTCGYVRFIKAPIWFVLLSERSNTSILARLNVKFWGSSPTCVHSLRCWRWQVRLLCNGIYITVLTRTSGLFPMSNRCKRHSWRGEGQTTDHIQAASGNLLFLSYIHFISFRLTSCIWLMYCTIILFCYDI